MKAAQDATGHVVDLSNCDREPIHIPGRVQPHGVVLALRETDLSVVQASANAAGLLGLPAEELAGRPAPSLFDGEDRERCRRWLGSADLRDGPLRLSSRGRPLDATAHRHDGALILELEDARDAGPTIQADYRSVRTAMGRLLAAGSLEEFCRVAAAEMRDLTGYDRVTVYRFDDDWNGLVYAEAKRDDLEPLLGLHFPASDIPEPARRIYHLSPIRMIADVAAEPSPLVPEMDPRTGRPLDLSLAILRGVSPVHIQYLKNMGVRASMSVSLMREGRLWGLLSCLHYAGPRRLPAGVRDACVFLGELVSAQIAVKEDMQGAEHRARLHDVRERLLQRMSAEGDLERGLPGEDLLALTGAAGAAVVHDGSCTLTGVTPTEGQVKRLVSWLRIHADGEVFHTDGLAGLCPEAAEFADVASGLVAISTSRIQGHHVLWFRPEAIRTVDWGGDPRKPVEGEDPFGLLSPRRSFALWQEVVKQRSLPWRPWEVDAARMLRDAIMAVVVRRAEELTRLNAELERSNADLDSFAFITSHDLKEPLRGIHNYATFVMEDYADRLDAEGRDKLETLVRLSQRLEDIVESLLHYSRLGRVDLAVEPTDMGEVLSGVLELLRLTLGREAVEVVVPRPLPVVRCDRTQAEILLKNLITNAVKYNDRPAKRVEIGYREPVDGPDRRPVFYVRDNGIGVPEKHRHAIFRMFKRLHGRDKFGGGTGAGLAFAKKIVERHGGSIWVESPPGEGATFYFTLGS
ncbi:Phytochrome-like protein cph1 [Aquisphaera giovannonii]|uniref:histidine kinase n=1 Tax=Aquisphaera giovannonii TaxID=406548 RepID=A0A5B9W4T4_9BACT|nr:ATP-binding protein [Aquisphaera giovannonii]QEH35267.1 Phytochrome-like protein cph1 [Aquisphaera giovannonii]